jgi:hypothetical protein
MCDSEFRKSDFLSWFSGYFQQEPEQIETLFENELARYFLFTWSIFESKCFNGFVRLQDLDSFLQSVEPFITENQLQHLECFFQYFHNRYQDKRFLKNLCHGRVDGRIQMIVDEDFNSVNKMDRLYFALYVIYRYRNNIFHGNKGVLSWLGFSKQIAMCISAMQLFIDVFIEYQSQSHRGINGAA